MTLLGYGSGAELAPFERSVDECLAQLGHLSRASAGDFSLEAEVLRLRRENAALRYRLARSPLRQRWNLLAAWAQRR